MDQCSSDQSELVNLCLQLPLQIEPKTTQNS